MYSHSEIQAFQRIIKPLCDLGTISPEMFHVALNAIKAHLDTRGTPHIKQEQLISRKEAAALLGCCTRTIDRLRKNNVIESVQYGTTSVRFRKSEILALIKTQAIVTKEFVQ